MDKKVGFNDLKNQVATDKEIKNNVVSSSKKRRRKRKKKVTGSSDTVKISNINKEKEILKDKTSLKNLFENNHINISEDERKNNNNLEKNNNLDNSKIIVRKELNNINFIENKSVVHRTDDIEVVNKFVKKIKISEGEREVKETINDKTNDKLEEVITKDELVKTGKKNKSSKDSGGNSQRLDNNVEVKNSNVDINNEDTKKTDDNLKKEDGFDNSKININQDEIDNKSKILDVNNSKQDSVLGETITKKKSKLLKWAIIFLLGFVSTFIITFILLMILFIPKILLEQEEILIEYNGEYSVNNFKAYNVLGDYSDKVEITDGVDNKKIGTYYIDYKLDYGFRDITKRLTVNVVDKKKPEITLKGDNEVFVCPGKEYKEDGYTAVDEYDGDLTDKVTVTKNDNGFMYQVMDNSNNVVSIERKISYEDKSKPKISLSGLGTMYIKLGKKYSEPGYKASDNCDGDLTSKVKVSGSVDYNKTGKYVLTYTVKDSNGNTNSVKRTVNVYKYNSVSSSTGEKGVIYLTFDDGPHNTYTKKILNTLKEEDVKATFFVTMKGSDSLIKRAYQEGHTVALHTASHEYSYIYSSVNNYFNDLDKIKARVKKITGEDSTIIRFPGGASNTVSRGYDGGIKIMTVLTSEVLNRGYRYYDWNVDSGDAGGCGSKTCVYNNVTKNLSKKRANVVLMHDIKSYTASALKDIIDYAKGNGYTFKAITKSTPMVVQKVNN